MIYFILGFTSLGRSQLHNEESVLILPGKKPGEIIRDLKTVHSGKSKKIKYAGEGILFGM